VRKIQNLPAVPVTKRIIFCVEYDKWKCYHVCDVTWSYLENFTAVS